MLHDCYVVLSRPSSNSDLSGSFVTTDEHLIKDASEVRYQPQESHFMSWMDIRLYICHSSVIYICQASTATSATIHISFGDAFRLLDESQLSVHHCQNFSYQKPVLVQPSHFPMVIGYQLTARN